MTNDEIINLAIENTIHGLKFDEQGLLRFAKLIAQHEREEIIAIESSQELNRIRGEFSPTAKDLVQFIQARGQA
jgi:hypothetical protein